ncbi:hypothetical protein [Tenggerimyces flavus]|uniref:hypothetical protein n=1 Tax=Tenggerimyces flavus TaxID=1708749 RepID=UPI0019603A94
MDEQDDACSGVGSADTDVTELAGDAQGDAACFVDLVAADAVVAVGAAVWAAPRFPDRFVCGRLCCELLIQVLVADLLGSPVADS